MAAGKEGHEALNPIHPSVLPHLDPAFVKLYNENIANTPNKPINLDFLRTKYSVLYSYGTAPAPEVGRIYDSTVKGHEDAEIAVRVYEPATPGPWPVHIDYHGGGWGLGDLDTESHICKHICHKANVAVIDVAYRLVPEHAYPTGILDAFSALRDIYTRGAETFRIDPARISVGGVSAGGMIAIILAHLARDADIPLKLVAVGTPVVADISQYKQASDSPFASMTEMAEAPTLNWARLKWFDELKWQSLSSEPAERERQMKSVAWFKNALDAPSFEGLCKLVVFTAGCDPLRDEGEAYARKCMESGCEVTLKRFPGVPHPFMHMDAALWQARDFIDMTAREIKHTLHES